jgi:hypothetical protein
MNITIYGWTTSTGQNCGDWCPQGIVGAGGG